MQPDANRKIEPAKFRGHRPSQMRALSLDVMGEAVAGHLWMHLKVPRDASKTELENYAREIVRRVRGDASENAIAELINTLQSQQLCERADNPAIRALARRAVAVVRQASAA